MFFVPAIRIVLRDVLPSYPMVPVLSWGTLVCTLADGHTIGVDFPQYSESLVFCDGDNVDFVAN